MTATAAKTSLKMWIRPVSNFITRIPCHSFFERWGFFWSRFWSWFWRTVSKLKKRSRKSLSCVFVLHKSWNKDVSRCSRATTAMKCKEDSFATFSYSCRQKNNYSSGQMRQLYENVANESTLHFIAVVARLQRDTSLFQLLWRTKTQDKDFLLLFFNFDKPIAFLPFSLPSTSSLLKLPIVVIQKFCYHGNVTSHFSSLLLSNLWFWTKWSRDIPRELLTIFILWNVKDDEFLCVPNFDSAPSTMPKL